MCPGRARPGALGRPDRRRRADGRGADCFIHAIRRAGASFISPLLYATLVWAALSDRVIFGTRLDLTSWLDAGIILAGAAFMAWRASRSNRRPKPRPDAGATETRR